MQTVPDTSVDVVVLSMGRTRETVETLQDVLSQRDVSVRLFVIDQGSDPQHLATLQRVAARDDRMTLVEVGHNLGVPGGRNLGIRMGSAPFVVSIDNDAVFDRPDALARVVERFQADRELGALAFRIVNHATGEPDWTAWAYPRALRARENQPFYAARFMGGGHALRRSAFQAAGGYDEALFFCEEELDLSYKLIALGWTIAYDPGVTVRHKVAAEARVRWDDRRLYLQVRNAVYLHWRHHRRWRETVTLAGGWVLCGLANGQGLQALRGVAGAVEMCLYRRGAGPRLGPSARRYIWEHDTRLRGSLLDRARGEVFARLPGR
jgi:GT2 family glycosyltransferase